jgi:hypothetical protein
MHHGAVLRDYSVHEIEVARDAPQVVEPAAGHEDHGDSAMSCFRDGLEYGAIDAVVARDRSVIIQRQD